MTPSQQAVEEALWRADAFKSDTKIDYAQTFKILAAEVRRLRAENTELRAQMRGLLAADDIAVPDEEEAP